MSIAEKLTTIAQNMPAVFSAGKKAAYDAFWDVFQNRGDPTNYYYKFSYDGWTDENYNPKYPIVCRTGTTAGMALFYENKAITDTKVPITVLGNSAQSMFCNSNLVTIRSLSVHKNVSLSSTFVNCGVLKNLTIGGTVGNAIDLQYSPKLSKDSIVSVINALSTETSGLAVTFSKSAMKKAFETADGANDGDTSSEWLALAATRTNWTISLA